MYFLILLFLAISNILDCSRKYLNKQLRIFS